MPLSVEAAVPAPRLAQAGSPSAPSPWRWAGLGLLLAVLLSACTTAQQHPPTSPPAPAAVAPAVPAAQTAVATSQPATPAETPQPAEMTAREAIERLLRFHERVRELPPAELAREITRLEARLALSPSPAASVPAAAPASAPATAASSAFAQGEAGASAVQAQQSLELALLLALQRQNGDLARALSLLEPLQRQDAAAATQPLARLLHGRLSEQRRLEEQLERQAQAVRELQRRADQLAAQLEALRAIERSLNTRPAAPAAPQASPR